MKTLKKLQLNDAKVLSNSEMKKILGGTGTGSGSGTVSCTYSIDCYIVTGIKDGSTASCSSSVGDCAWVTNMLGIKIGVKCEGQTYKC